MEHLKHPNLKVHYHFTILIKFLLPLILLPLLLKFFKPFLTQFFTDTIGKTYMFLLCNGLLVFIAMNSGLINPSSPRTHQSIEEVAVDNERSSQLQFNVSEIAAPLAVADENVMEIEPPQEKQESLAIVEQENVISDTQLEDEDEDDDDDDDDDDEGNGLMIVDEDEHGAEDTEELNKKCEEDEHGAEDTEELNKKCEDFIRKMKAAFCSEPRADYSYYFDNNQKTMVAAN